MPPRFKPEPRTPPPPWWAEMYAKRQADLRRFILRDLRRAGRAMAAPELRMLHSAYWACEYRQCLQDMTDRGELARSERTVPHSHGQRVMRTFTFYDLAERQA